MKKFIRLFVFIGVLALALTGCANKKNVAEKNEQFTTDYIAFQGEWNAATTLKASLAKGLTLPTSYGETTITWTSSDTTVLTNDGQAVPQENGGLYVNANGELDVKSAKVTLTATLSLKGATVEADPVVFNVNVDLSTEDANKIVGSYLALQNVYGGANATLTGYGFNFVNGAVSGSKLELVQRAGVAYKSNDTFQFAENSNVAVVNRPTGAENAKSTIDVTFTSGNLSYDWSYPVTITPQPDFKTTADIWAMENSAYDSTTEYTFTGFVSNIYQYPTDKSNFNGFWVQSGTQGIFVYSYSKTDYKVTLGDFVAVTSSLTLYSNLLETKKVSSVSVLSPAAECASDFAALPKLAPKSLNDFKANSVTKGSTTYYMGQLVEVACKYKDGTLTTNVSGIINFTLENGDVISMRVDKNTSEFAQLMATINGLHEGQDVIVRAALGQYNANPQLYAGGANTITFPVVERTDADIVADNKAALKVTNLNVIKGQTYTLVANPTEDATVTWSLKEAVEGVTVQNGVVSVASTLAANANFTVVATITKGAASDTKEFAGVALVTANTVTEALTAFEGGATTAFVSGTVSDVLGQNVVITDGRGFIVLTLGANTTAQTGDTFFANVTNASKNGNAYVCAATEVAINANSKPLYAGTELTADQALTAAFGKVVFKGFAYNEQKQAQLGSTAGLQLLDANDLTGATVYAGAVKTYVEGYLVKMSDTQYGLFVTDTFGTIAEAQEASATNTTVRVRGTVVATYARGAMIYDGTDYILVYVSAANLSADPYQVGQYLDVYGKVSQYKDKNQFSVSNNPAVYVTELSTDTYTQPTATAITHDNFASVSYISYVEMTIKVTSASSSYVNGLMVGSTTEGIAIVYLANNSGFVTGKTYKVTGYAMYKSEYNGVVSQYVMLVSSEEVAE